MSFPQCWWGASRRLCLALALLLAAATTTPTLALTKTRASEYFVYNLPGAPKDRPLVKMHAGHIEVVPEHNGHLFFWHFANNHIADRQRTVIWLNGGPGCSSEDGALMEIGPYRVKSPNELAWNNGTWNEFANLLFVDNPVGTGFSYVNTDSYVHELDEMADQFVKFLETWFKLFPEYEGDELYLAGESYAGQHIPYIAKHIIARNQKVPDYNRWNLSGLIIGNGWMSPRHQYGAYLDFAFQKGLLDPASEKAKELQATWRQCESNIAVSPDAVDIADCEAVLSQLLSVTRMKDGKDGKDRCYNMYDVRLTDTYASCGMNWPPDLKHVTPYLRREDVTKALNLNPQKNTGWTECSGAVSHAFRPRKSVPSERLLPDLLQHVPITLFSGAEDLICNHLGTERMLESMTWNGATGLGAAERRGWNFDGHDAGFWQEARNLTYVLFRDASHMVPFDFPLRSRDMLDRIFGIRPGMLGLMPAHSVLAGDAGYEAGSNSTGLTPAQEEAVQAAKWEAYRRSGSVALVVVAIAATAWGIFVWRDRRRRRGYLGVMGRKRHFPRGSGGRGAGGVAGRGLESFRHKMSGRSRDLETGDFDESELDDLHVESPTVASSAGHDKRYDVGSDEEDDEEREEDGGQAKETAGSNVKGKGRIG